MRFIIDEGNLLTGEVGFYTTAGVNGAGFDQVRSGFERINRYGKVFLITIKRIIQSIDGLPWAAIYPILNVGDDASLQVVGCSIHSG